jgi:hypothetical protein
MEMFPEEPMNLDNIKFDRQANKLFLGTLPRYYQSALGEIELTPPSQYVSLNIHDLKDNYTSNIGRVDEIIKNVTAGEDDLFARQYSILSNATGNADDAVRALSNDAFSRLDDTATLNELADYEVMRSVSGLPLYPAALLAGGIGASIAGLDPLQSLGTGIAATAAIPVTDAILNANPSLRKYKAVTGIRPAAAAITGILTALGFKTLSPEQEQQLLDRGMQYAQQSGGMG